MFTEEDFQKAFFKYIEKIEDVNLNLICKAHSIELDIFINWIAADPIRRAKVDELTETRILDLQKSKRKSADAT